MITFVIPLGTFPNAEYATRAMQLFNSTLRCLERQTCDRWKAIVVSDNSLTLSPSMAKKVTVIPRVGAPPLILNRVQRNREDMSSRRMQGASAALQTTTEYIMFLDADDLLHRRLVETVLNGPRDTCYYINDGYQYLYNFHRLLPLDGVFYAKCHSGVIVPANVLLQKFELGSAADPWQFHHHQYLSRLANCRRLAIPFRAGIYCTEHGTNNSTSLHRFFREGDLRSNLAYSMRLGVKLIVGKRLSRQITDLFDDPHAMLPRCSTFCPTR